MEKKYIARVLLKRPVEPSSYLHQIPALQHFFQEKSLSFTEDVTFFVGENGAGKSTLLEAIAIAYGFNAEGGSKNFNFSTRYTHSNLYESLTLVKSGYAKDGYFLRAESFYNLATNIESLDETPAGSAPIINSYGGKSLHAQSHGESFLTLMQNRFFGNGIYILDEPEAALSPRKQLELLARMQELVRQNSQFIVATHSPMLMALPGARIYEFSERGICPAAYQDTEHYRLTKQFLQNPERILRYLLEE